MKTVLSRFPTTALAIIALGSSSIALSAEDAGNDYRTFHADGRIDKGNIEASYLVMYLARNQCMAMEELITVFQSNNPDIETIYVETIPPGQILNGQILKQGMIDGQKTSQTPLASSACPPECMYISNEPSSNWHQKALPLATSLSPEPSARTTVFTLPAPAAESLKA